MSLAPAKSQARVIMQRMRNGQFCSGVAAQNSSFVLLAVAMLAIGLDVGVARITYGVVLPAFARDLQLSLTAAGLLGTVHLIGYLLGTLASPSLNAKVGALALCRASHFVFACAMLVCGLASVVTTMAAGRFVAGLAAGFGVFSIFLIVFDATEPEKRSAAGSLVWSGIGVAIVASGLACGPILDGGAWRLSFIVPAILALAVAVLIPRTASAARAQPKAADASPSRLAELTSGRWIFLIAAYFLFAAGYISYSTFAGVMLKGIGLSSGGVTWFWVMYGASSIAGAALGAALLSGGFARRIALSAALGSGAIGSLLVVHGENGSVFAASSVLVGLGSVATPAIVTFLIRNRTNDAPIPSSLRSAPRAWVSASSADLRSGAFSATGSVSRPSAGSPLRVTAQACLPPPPTASSANDNP